MNTHHAIPTAFYIRIEGRKTALENLKSKSLYENLVSKISSKAAAQKKYDERFNTQTFQLDWEKMYLLPFNTTLDNKLREFQYKILHRIVCTE